MARIAEKGARGRLSRTDMIATRAMQSPSKTVDWGLSVLRRSGPTIFAETIVPAVFCCMVLVFTFEFVVPNFFETNSPDQLGTQVVEALTTLFVLMGVALPLFLVGLSYASLLVSRLTADHLLGHRPDPRTARRVARENLGVMVKTCLITMLRAFFPLVAAIVFLLISAIISGKNWDIITGAASVVMFLSLMISVPWAFATDALSSPVVATEGQKGLAACRRSRRLLGSWTPDQRTVPAGTRAKGIPSGYPAVLTTMLLIAFASLVIIGGINLAYQIVSIDDYLLRAFGSGLTGELIEGTFHFLPIFLWVWFSITAWSAAMMANYLERRIGTEGYDIELLQQEALRSTRQVRFQL